MQAERPRASALVVDGVAIDHVDAGGGEVVVLLPGLLASHRWFQRNLEPLSQRFRVIALDLPGFGRSGKPDAPYSVPWLAALVSRFLEAKGIERAHLVGNSLGGQVAMALALARPALVERLVLVAPAGVVAWPAMLERLVGAAAPLAGARLPRVPEAAVALVLRAVFPGQAELAARFARGFSRGIGAPDYPLVVRAAARALHGSLAHPMLEAAREIRQPTLIMWGERDRVLSVAGARALRQRIAGAELSIYPDSGHCPMLDAAARWNREVTRFLDGEQVGV